MHDGAVAGAHRRERHRAGCDARLNEEELTVYQAGEAGEISADDLPAMPWTVEARSSSGRVLTSMVVRSGDLRHIALPGGGEEFSGAITIANLSCGRLVVWAGYTAVSVPAPAPGAGEPGDCEP